MSMRRALQSRFACSGMSLAELMMTVGISAFVVGGMTTGLVAINRSLAESSRDAQMQDAQSRVLDYLARDAANATARSGVSATGVTFTVPNFYITRNPSAPVPTPTSYNQTAATFPTATVTYSYDATARTLTRTVRIGSTDTSTVLARDLSFTLSNLGSSNWGPTATQPFTVTLAFNLRLNNTATAGTEISRALRPRLAP